MPSTEAPGGIGEPSTALAAGSLVNASTRPRDSAFAACPSARGALARHGVGRLPRPLHISSAVAAAWLTLGASGARGLRLKTAFRSESAAGRRSPDARGVGSAGRCP